MPVFIFKQMAEDLTILDPLMEKLKDEKQVARKFQERRHNDWDENYELYRNKVRINRLTQRQAVNVPIMKETIKTLLSKIDDPPNIEFKELSGDEQKEIYTQTMWDDVFENQNLEAIDIQDKKTVLLYGRAFKKLNYNSKDGFSVQALDIYDVVVDPMVDPLDIETARYVIHQNIFRSLKDILADKRYTEKGKNELKTYLSEEEGVIISGENEKAYKEKQERLIAMGADESDFDTFGAGAVIVNLSEHHTYKWVKDKFVRWVYTYADDHTLLLDQSLEKAIGIDFLPLTTWGDDVETQDFWSDAPGDLVRTPNKVLNIWFSQMIENRTLRNFNMHWYDSTIKGYSPQTYEPGQGIMLPAPGDPYKTIKPVEVSGLEDTVPQMDWLIKLIERGTSSTAQEKGVSEKKQITLGEVETLLGQSMERTLSMAKFYRRSWKELAEKWYKIMDANTGMDDKTTFYKTSSKGKIWPKDIRGRDWKSDKGYRVEAHSSSEQEAEKGKGIQRMMFVKQQFPDNPVLAEIMQKRVLELLDLTPEELRNVNEFEKRKIEMMQNQPLIPEVVGQPAGQQAQPARQSNQELVGGIQDKVNQINQIQNV